MSACEKASQWQLALLLLAGLIAVGRVRGAACHPKNSKHTAPCFTLGCTLLVCQKMTEQSGTCVSRVRFQGLSQPVMVFHVYHFIVEFQLLFALGDWNHHEPPARKDQIEVVGKRLSSPARVLLVSQFSGS